MTEVFVVMSNNLQSVREKEIEFITFDESKAERYMEDMEFCDTRFRSYWVECWEVE